MQQTLDLPLTLKKLSPEVVTWLLAKSAQTGKPADEVAKDAIKAAARSQRRQGSSPSSTKGGRDHE